MRIAILLVAAGSFSAAQGVFPSPLPSWEGHDWNEWRKVTGWRRPELRTAQAGRRDLHPLLAAGGAQAGPIDSLQAWEGRRAEFVRTIGAVLGSPRSLERPPPEAQDLGEEVLPDHVRRRLRIRSEPDDWIPAYLLVPRPAPAAPAPAFVCLHQTVAQGKEEPGGIRGDPELAFALELVRRGFVCLAPDAIGFGERIPPGKQPYHDSIAFYRRHPSWSFMGKMVWDVSRAVDHLETIPFVDPRKIGVIGHSHGGYGGLFAAALEPRISLAVASCGFNAFRADPSPERWSHATALIPQLGMYLPDVAAIPFDWHQVCALIAPRPLFVWYATEDAIFPSTGGLEGLLAGVRGVYELHGAGRAMAWKAFKGPHRFPASGREEAYKWIEAMWGVRAAAPAAPPPPPAPPEAGPPPPPAKSASAFFPARLLERARENARRHPWAVQARDSIAAAARPWMEIPDDALWDLLFSTGIKRSWMVWSNGHCPACRKPVPMYEWKTDALHRPWKMGCPHCKELFPKNDFLKFYRSGLDRQGIFDPGRADRSLLFNAEHPDPADPLRRFGVDDGEGYLEGANRWRFIGAYLIFGQWKQAVLGGIRSLAAAHAVTGDPAFARKAGILLDRVADLYPTFDFGKEGVMYEGPPRAGYVSTWHDACVEARELAIAYDAVFEAIARDPALVGFLSARARERGLPNPKATFQDIQRNIEERILRDTLAHREKIESNYPTTDVTVVTIAAVLGWPGARGEITALVDQVIERAVAADGLTGEKGLDGYSAIAPRAIADLLGHLERLDPGFLREALRRHPRLHDMYRFHLDAWCLGRYYPRIGDTGSFATRNAQYAGVGLSSSPGIAPSGFTFLWDLYEATGDLDFVRLLHAANGGSTAGLPHDLFAADPAALQARVARLIADRGPQIRLRSADKPRWCLAILRSGAGEDARAAWLDYDSGGGHGHADGMNLGLFAKGLDLLPDLGYPPVQYGGWSSPRALWYTRTAAHNTVLVDGQDTRPASGTATLWADGKEVRAVRASGPRLIAGERYERTVALIDLSPRDSYLVDVFRVRGGKEHSKLLHACFGRIEAQGLSLQAAGEPGFGDLMRGFRKDPSPPVPWIVDWTIEDRLGYLPAGSEVHLRYTDLTPGAEALLAEPPRQNSVGFAYPEANFKRGALLRAALSMIRRSGSALTMRRSA